MQRGRFAGFARRRGAPAAIVTAVAAMVWGASLASAQKGTGNPLAGDANAIRTGTSLFQAGCSDCHGIDAKGVLGPDLTTVWTAGATDERLFRTIREGVSGTPMPSSRAPDEEIWSILAYLRTLSTSTPPVPSTGDAASGERIFWSQCGGCHRVGERGGYLGPDLSRVGSSRSREALVRDIRDASASLVPGYRPVTIVTADGRRIRGVKKSEDAYSIRIMDANEHLQGYAKASLREVIDEPRSVMPDFTPSRLSDRDLDDLLRFLGTLRTKDTSHP
jgi:putative heme-binding domain-containing protein